MTTHGLSMTKIYHVWEAMKGRCSNPKNQVYRYYGARGVTVCGEWVKFEAFYEDMGPSYKEGLSIDRVDNDKGYSKDNCRWATRSQQQHNKTSVGRGTSKYLGVSWCANKKRWHARINVHGKQRNAGYFRKEEDAAEAYNTAKKQIIKELNL